MHRQRVSAAELLIGPFRLGPAAVSTVDRFLRQPMLGVAEVDMSVARGAARAIADARLARLPDALIAATARALALPLVTGDRSLSRAGVATSFCVRDYTE
jgi:predicted nucleic acid-binding protein